MIEDINPYWYEAEWKNVVDGDTIDLEVDLGFTVSKDIRVRLSGVDTHEIHGVSADSKEFKLGKKEANFVRGWLPDHKIVYVETEKTGKFGRWLGTVYRQSDGECLNERLLREFEGVEYDP